MLRGVNQGHQIVSQLTQHTALEDFALYAKKRNWSVVFNVGDDTFYMVTKSQRRTEGRSWYRLQIVQG